MKLVAIIGSPKGMRGNTGRALAGVIDAAKAEGAEVTTFELGKLDIKPCIACEVCHKDGECTVEDDFQGVLKAMLDADGLILASPNYVFNVSAQLKTLIDRTSCQMHCQMMENKYGAAVVTSGGGDCKEVEEYVLRYLRAMGYWTVGSVGFEAWRLSYDQSVDETMEAAAQLGKDLATAIREKKTYPDQEEKRRPFYERMKALVKARKDNWKAEYEYWQARGRV